MDSKSSQGLDPFKQAAIYWNQQKWTLTVQVRSLGREDWVVEAKFPNGDWPDRGWIETLLRQAGAAYVVYDGFRHSSIVADLCGKFNWVQASPRHCGSAKEMLDNTPFVPYSPESASFTVRVRAACKQARAAHGADIDIEILHLLRKLNDKLDARGPQVGI